MPKGKENGREQDCSHTNGTGSDDKSDSPWRDEALLRRLYLDEELTTTEIGEQLGCSSTTIVRWLNEHGIETRGVGGSNPEKPWRDEELMRRLYVEERLTIREIADRLDCGRITAKRWVNKHGIETRKTSSRAEPDLRDGELLRELFVERDLTTEEVAEELGCAPNTVTRWLDEHGITEGRWTGSPWRDEELIREKYVEEGLTVREIADEWDCSKKTVGKWLDEHGIETRGRGPEEGAKYEHMRGHDYGPNWPTQREKTLRRDTPEDVGEPVCQRCGMTQSEHEEEHGRGLHVHHIVPIEEFRVDGELDYERANRVENLVTCCYVCHRVWERCTPLRLQLVYPLSVAGEFSSVIP